MKKPLLINLLLSISYLGFAQTAPKITYSSPNIFTAGMPIASLSPSNSGGVISASSYGTTTTFAGSGNRALINGTGTAASFNNPSGVAIDNAGNLYIADQNNNVIRKITQDGTVTILVGNVNGLSGMTDGNGTGAAFSNPCGVAVDVSGNVYVTDRYNNRIRKITPAGDVTTFAGSGLSSSTDGIGTAASFYQPYGIAIDQSGNLYVADQLGQKIRKITPAGVVTTVAGSGNSASANGIGTAASFYNPTGVVVDNAGNIYVAESMGNYIRKISPAGVVSTFAGNGNAGYTDGQGTTAVFNRPTGISIDNTGNLYVADQGSQTIRVITSTGNVSTLAGNNAYAGSANGVGTAANFYQPIGIAVGGNKVYVADSFNNRIRAISIWGYSISPVLPLGLNFDSQTGVISGTAMVVTAATNYTVVGQNAYGKSNTLVNIATTIPAIAPAPASIYPTVAALNTMVIISGSNFVGATAVSIGGKNISSFNILSATKITAIVPDGTTSGSVTVTNPYGIGTLAGFTITTVPKITYTSPNSYSTGVTITALSPANTGGDIPESTYGKVITLAGNGNQQSTDGGASTASFSYPTGLTTDVSGNIYVTETYGNRIRKVTPSGIVTTFAGSGGYGSNDGAASAATFSNPMALVFDEAGNMFVADRGNNKIRKITSDGIVSTFVGNGSYGNSNGMGTTSSFYYPSAIVADISGNLYVADAGNNLIRKITPAGAVSTFAGGAQGTFNNPSGLAIDGSGNLYVTDRGNNVIKKVTPSGAISVFAGNGTATSLDGQSTSASFTAPTGITIDMSGNLYITESFGRIRTITSNGVVTTIAGGDGTSSVDGIGTDARFSSPWGIAVDASGHLYVADQSTGKIRRIDITGFSINPALPQGLTLGVSGVITGTPTVATPATDYTIKAANIAGISTVAVNIATQIPALPPTITSVSPSAVGYGKTISINGTNFLGATSVKIGATSVEFRVLSPSAISVVVNTHTSGSISVTNPYGSATSAGFTIIPPPDISYPAGNVFTVGTAIANLAPVNNGSAIPKTIYGQTSTFAGNGNYDNVNGTGTAASIAMAQGIAVDAANNVYVSDSYHQIRKITPAGVVTTFAGSGVAGNVNGTGTAASFSYPQGIAVNAAGDIYVVDSQNHLIRKITPAGVVTTFAGSGNSGATNGQGTAASFNYPNGIAIDANSNLFIADQGNNMIRKITPEGTVTTFAGSTISGFANGVGNAALFNRPVGLTFDATGNLYIADQYNNQIRKITPAGEVTTFAGSTTSGKLDGLGTAASFNTPGGISSDSYGNLYVADNNNNLIRAIAPDGTVTTLAGNGVASLANGSGNAVSFSSPKGVAIDSNGNLYVADYWNSVIRKVITTGYHIATVLPDGLRFDSSTGTISGTPNTSLPKATQYKVYGYNNIGSSTTVLDITIKIPPVPPAITSFMPVSAGVNNTLTITGENFTDATSVEIGGVAASFKVISRTIIVARIGAGATSSDIKITNAYGTNTISGFSLIQPPAIAYTGPQTYKTGTVIIPLNVTNSGGNVPNAVYGKTITIAGGTKSPSANLYQLVSVVADASGNAYATLATSNAILKITPAGLITTFAGSVNAGFTNGTGTTALFNAPKSLTIDADGNLYVLEPNNFAIRKVTPQGVVSTYATYINGYNDENSFISPTGIAIDKFGNLYVADYARPKISKITSAGIITTIAGSSNTGAKDGPVATASFNSPQGIAVDDFGNIYVADQGNQKIRKIIPDSVVSTLAGSGKPGNANGTGTAASFVSPLALTVDASGNVYVADTYNNLIRKITPAGLVTTLAGSGTAGYLDETGTGAYFNSPIGIFAGASGNVYVADGSNSIRKIASSGYAVSPVLPAGLTIDESGVMNGTPTEVSAAKDYTIEAYNNGGVGTATVKIGVEIPAIAPVIASFTQASQNPGSGITITGSNFIGATAITIGGVAAVSYTVLSPTTIIAYASHDAVSGSVKVTNPYGDGTHDGLVFKTAPKIGYSNTLSFTAGTAIKPIEPANSGTPIPAQAYGQFTTIAGSGTAGSVNGTGTAAGFNYLAGSTVDKLGNIYIIDDGAIRKITPTGVVTTFAGPEAGFSQPMSIVSDASGNLFVTDRANNLIRKITPEGKVSKFAGTGNYGDSNDGTGTQAGIFDPWGITIDGAGNLYVVENSISKIRKITPSGVVTTIAGSGSRGAADGIGALASFSYPSSIVADFYGNLYIADTYNNLIRKVTPGGVVTTLAGSGNNDNIDGTGKAASIGNPIWLTIDGSGNLYTSDGSGLRIRKITAAGVVTTVTNTSLGHNAITYLGSGSLCMDASGNLIVGDLNNHLVSRFSLTGYNIIPALPAGFKFDGATGVISGTPQYVAIKPLTFKVTGYNAVGSNSTNVSFTVGYPAAPQISYPTKQTFTVAALVTPILPANSGGGVPEIGYGKTSTFAGSGAYDAVDGSSTTASFSSPTGLTFDAAGNLYVAQQGNPKIRKVTPDGTVTTYAGTGGFGHGDGPATSAEFNEPINIVFDSKGNLFVTESTSHVIRKISGGQVTTFAGIHDYAGHVNGYNAQFNTPWGLEIDKDDNLYVADRENNVIRKITPAGFVSDFVGSGTVGYVNGKGAAASFNHMNSLKFGNDGNLYVADSRNNVIRKVTPDGTVSTFTGSGNVGSQDGPATSASFNSPTSIAKDGFGNFYVTDYISNLIRKITTDGTVTTVAGNGQKATVDGAGKTESFNNPVCLVVAPDNNSLYVSDYGGNVIRKVELFGYTINKQLPDGLFFDGATGKISGIPSVASPATDYTITAINAGGSSSSVINIAVSPALAPNISYTNPQETAVNLPVTITPVNSGGVVPATAYAATTTFAGSGTANSADGTLTAAGFHNPIGMVSDKLANIYVADQANNKIRKITQDGVVSTFAGNGSPYTNNGTGTAASIGSPTSIAIDSKNNLYVTDRYNGTVRKITPAGVVTTLDWLYYSATDPAPYMPLTNPYGITIDVFGNMYISDQTYNTIRKVTYSSTITPSNIISVLAGSGSIGSANGTGSAASFNQPAGLTTDAAGNVYVADRGNNLIRKITTAGVVTTFAGNGTAGAVNGKGTAASFNQPTNIAIDVSGNLYVADMGNNMIRMITPDGIVTTFAGNTISGFTNAIGLAAKFNAPAGITFDPIGRLYVSEGNNVIRNIYTSGYTIDQALPAGLSFNGATGIISGAPTVLAPAKDYNVTAYNYGGNSIAKVNIEVKEKVSQTLTFPALSNMVYGDADLALNATSNNNKIPVTYSSLNPEIATIVNGKLHINNAGTVSITTSQAGDDKHDPAPAITQSLIINKKTLTVIANDANWSYGKAGVVFTMQYDGFVNGEDASKLTTAPLVTTTANLSTLDPGVFDLVPGNGASPNYNFVYVNGKLTITLPVTNFMVSATSITCKGANNGIITIVPTKALNYTAVVTGNGYNQTYNFNSETKINNLTAGTYHVCVSADNLPENSQCSDVLITEPKDLSVYSTVNKTVNTVSLNLNGGDNYTIQLNGKEYKTSNSLITLPLKTGSNKLMVTTDKLCQGTVEQTIDLSGITPYPNPFQDVLYINLGENVSAVAFIKIFKVNDGRQVFSQKFTNQSGIVRLDVSNLKFGVYTLNLSLDNKESVFKIIKQ
jgi:sugar lactone lactonase YvrE